jgi:hypothetical protein
MFESKTVNWRTHKTIANRKKTKAQTMIYKPLHRKTKDRVTRTSLKTGSELWCSGRVSRSCPTCGISRVTLVTNTEIYFACQIQVKFCIDYTMLIIIKDICLRKSYMYNYWVFVCLLCGDLKCYTINLKGHYKLPIYNKWDNHYASQLNLLNTKNDHYIWR